jgi:hypothetical protein
VPTCSTCLIPSPVIVAQFSFPEDTTTSEREFTEVANGPHQEMILESPDMEAYNALAWFCLITMLVGVMVMGMVALQRSLSER